MNPIIPVFHLVLALQVYASSSSKKCSKFMPCLSRHPEAPEPETLLIPSSDHASPLNNSNKKASILSTLEPSQKVVDPETSEENIPMEVESNGTKPSTSQCAGQKLDDDDSPGSDISQEPVRIWVVKRAPPPKRSKKAAPFLRDESNTVTEVLPQTNDISIVDQLKTLIDRREYDEACALGEGMDTEEFLKLLCQAITSLKHYQGFFNSTRRHMLTSFLIYGVLAVVSRAILSFRSNSEYFINDTNVHNAIALSLLEGYYDRTVNLLDIAKRRAFLFSDTVFRLFEEGHIVFERDVVLLKHFLTIKGEELSKEHSIMLQTICQVIILFLKRNFNPTIQKFIADMIAQPFLLVPKALPTALLHENNDADRVTLIEYNWGEAVKEGLKGDCRGGGKDLWNVILCTFPGEFPIEYPPSEDVLASFLGKFKTKQQLEEIWAEKNAHVLQTWLESLELYFLPEVLWRIISVYAITWVYIE